MLFRSMQIYKFLQNHVKYMSITSNTRYLSYLKPSRFTNPIYFKTSASVLTQLNKHFCLNHNILQRVFIDKENTFAYRVMQSLPIYEKTLITSIQDDSEKEVTSYSSFEQILSKNWRLESATNITEAFKKLIHYSKDNNIPLSDSCFDKLVDGLMDKCQDLTDDELCKLLCSLSQYPPSESPTSHNIHDIWSALDDMCCQRIKKWSVPKTLLVLDLWYNLNLAKHCHFSIQAIKKFCRRVQQLSHAELIQTLFYINICRKQWSMFDFEIQFDRFMDELTLDEIGIVSMAFFKTKTSIKESLLLSRILKKLLEETSTVNEITLSAILKILRYSKHLLFVDQIYELLTKLIPEIDRLSLLCCIHIALLGTVTQVFHPEILQIIAEKFVRNMSAARLKDIERFTFTLSLYNFNPNTTPNFYELARQELKKPEREKEIQFYPKSFSCAVHYLGLRQIYDYELINKVLDPAFILHAYGKNKRSYGRELLFLNASIDFDCSDYKGHRLPKKLHSSLSTWLSDWIPKKNSKYRLTAADKLAIDIWDSLEVVHGNENFYHMAYTLPHFSKSDIIIAKDANGKPVENIKKYFEKYKIGDTMKPEPLDGVTWYAIIIGSWNMVIRGTSEPLGSLNIKLKHLKHIGYIPVLVPWNEYFNLSRKEKEDYLYKKIT